MTEDQLSADIARGESAKAVIENEAFKLAFDALTNDLTNKWQNSPARDAEGREKLYLMLTLTKAFRANLESLILSGRLAQDKRRSLMERVQSSLPAWMNGSD